MQEDVQLGLEFVLLTASQRCRSSLLLDHLGTQTEDCLFQAIAKLEVLWQLREFGEELFAAGFGHFFHVAGLHHEGRLRLEQACRRLGLLLFLLVHFEILGSNLLDYEIECVFELANSLTRAWELGNFRVLVSQAATIGFDHIEIGLRVQRLAELNREVDVCLLLHKDILQTGLPLRIFFILSLAARD